MLENMITDRTYTDFQRWLFLRNKGYANMTESERAEWGEDMKGAYNASDLNRVGKALNYLYERLHTAGYIKPSDVFTAKTDWNSNDIPTAEQFTHYIKAVSIIRGAVAQFATTPQAPADTGSLNYVEANNIEQIMLDVDKLITNMIDAQLNCGEIYAGEI